MAPVSRWAPTIGCLFVACVGCAHVHPPTGRYLYEVSCEAEVARFDTVEKKKTGEYALAKRPGAEGLVPTAVGVLEVCLAKDTVFDPGASVFHTLVPTQSQQSAALTLSYRLLSFSVPAITLVAQAPAGNELEYPPRLELAGGRVRVVLPGEPLPLGEDLSGFAPEHRPIPNEILEWSGARLLLRLNEKEPSFAVADRLSKTLVRLQDLPISNDGSIHMSPGGTHVLVEELSGAGVAAAKTGRLVIHDARTGLLVKALLSPGIVGLYYRGMAPTGVALYQGMGRDQFVELDMTFPGQEVLKPNGAEFPPPAVFFADR